MGAMGAEASIGHRDMQGGARGMLGGAEVAPPHWKPILEGAWKPISWALQGAVSSAGGCELSRGAHEAPEAVGPPR